MNKAPLLVIAGPTASGKTSLAVECAKHFNGEVVSADSMQIYKGMNIATAKPDKDEMQGIKHHLIDFLDIDKTYSVAQFVNDANLAIKNIHSKGMLPILAGGTGLYIDSLVENVKFTDVETDLKLRKQLELIMKETGAENMLEELSLIDSETAQGLHPNNTKRIIRAFEVYYLTGKTLTQINNESKAVPSPYNICYIGINYRNRDVLYDRINRRVDLMIENGLLEEAKRYYDIPNKSTSSQAIGYKEFKPYFKGEISYEQAVENLKLSTRHYAKRQLTWFKRNNNIIWFYPDEYENTELLYKDVFKTVEKVI